MFEVLRKIISSGLKLLFSLALVLWGYQIYLGSVWWLIVFIPLAMIAIIYVCLKVRVAWKFIGWLGAMLLSIALCSIGANYSSKILIYTGVAIIIFINILYWASSNKKVKPTLIILIGLHFITSYGHEFHKIDLEKAGWSGRFKQTDISKAEWTEKKVVVEKTINGREIKVEQKVKVETPALVKANATKEAPKATPVKAVPEASPKPTTQSTQAPKNTGTVLDFIRRTWSK